LTFISKREFELQNLSWDGMVSKGEKAVGEGREIPRGLGVRGKETLAETTGERAVNTEVQENHPVGPDDSKEDETKRKGSGKGKTEEKGGKMEEKRAGWGWGRTWLKARAGNDRNSVLMTEEEKVPEKRERGSVDTSSRKNSK